MQRGTKLLLSQAMALTLMTAGQAEAAGQYAVGMTYTTGEQVCYLGDLYQAKWWSGPDEVPTDVDLVAEAWETPWQRLTADADECGVTEPGNRPPTVTLTATPEQPDPNGQVPVTLTANASDPDGDPLSHVWSQVAGSAPSVAIIGPDQAVAFVILPEANQPVQYEFLARVSDGQASVTKTVNVDLLPVFGNQAPVAVADADTTTLEGAGFVQLSGLDSSDPDGDTLSYQWQQIYPATPRAEFADTSAAEPMVSLPDPLAATSYVFELVVSDGELTGSAQITVNQHVAGEANTCPLWQMGSVYIEGDVVSHAGERWRAHWWTQDEEPGSTGDWGVWRLAGVETGCSGGVDLEPEPEPEPGGGAIVALSDLLATEAALTDTPQMSAVKQAIATRDNAVVEAIQSGLATNPANVRRVERIVSESDWNHLFPRRAPEYTYRHFLQAIGKFPAFCGDYDDGRDAEVVCRKALATLFAHFTQETGGHTDAWPEPQWPQGLVYLRELGWSEDMPNGYGLCDTGTWQGQSWPCSAFPEGHANAGQFKSYFGRGAKQLSYNYNYGPFSQAMFGDVSVLLEQPNLVADTWLNLASAVFFYVYPQPPKPSMLHALDGTWQPNQHDLNNGLEPGFGVTTQIINGGIECGGSSEHAQSQNRIDYYQQFANYLGVPVPADEVLGCADMQRFETQGAGALDIYWEQDWSQANACKLVNYQTPFSAFITGDYAACIDHFFDVEIDYDN